MYDLIIVGGGPAAISAGIYAARRKIKTLLICENWGGQIVWAPLVVNYPGTEPPVTGMELVDRMVKQLKKNELEIKDGLVVEKVASDGKIVKVETKKGNYEAKGLIVATGKIPRKLGVDKEEEYIGKGISYCTTCDGPLYKDKVVAVVGGGGSGAASVLEVSSYAKKIYWIISTLRAENFYVDKIKALGEKVEWVENVRATGIKADKFVNALILKDKNTEKEKEIKVDGVFVAVGSDPNSVLVKDVVELDEIKQIKIDSHNRTSMKNIFAAGDVTNMPYKQLTIAVGEGAKAALSVCEFLLNC